MDRTTPSEQQATMLGSRLLDGDIDFRSANEPACLRALRATELLFHLCAWVLLIIAAISDGRADDWHAETVIDEFSPYEFSKATADAIVVAFLSAIVAGGCALHRVPGWGMMVSGVACVACVAKCAAMLHAGSSLRMSAAVLAAAATGCLVVGSAIQCLRQRRRRQSASLESVDDGLESGIGDGVIPPNTYTRRAPDGTGQGASVGRLLGLAAPERRLLVVGTVGLMGATTSSMAMPALIGRLLSIVTDRRQEHPHEALAHVTLTLIGIFAVGALFSFVRGYLFTLAGERVVARLRSALFSHLISLEIGFFDESKTGELMNRLSSDTAVLQNAVTVNVSMGLRFCAQVLIALAAVFLEQWSLALVMLSVVPAIAIAAILYARFIKRVASKYQECLAEAATVAQESLGAVRTVRSFAMEGKETKRYAAAVQASYEQGARRAFFYGVFVGSIGLVGQSAVVLVLFYGGNLVLRDASKPGGFDSGRLMSFLLYTVMIAGGLGGISDLFGTLMNAVGASKRIFDIFDRVSTIANHGGETLPACRGVLQFTDVSFAYPTRPDVLVLDRVSLTIQPGTVVALCGPSGSGKSSIIQLIERFYDPQTGFVLVDGTPLSQLDASWWRKQAALVAQEPVLFANSVAQNITYGVAASQDDVVTAARTANAHTFISAFPDGYQTLVGERGVQLSGGQKQRIALARALLVDPRMLLLDEATSALDAESEHIVQEAIDRLMKNRTTVVVAHRLSTIRTADVICVISKGRIVERGSHDELLSQADGLYTKLVQRQMAGKNGRESLALSTRSSEMDLASAEAQ